MRSLCKEISRGKSKVQRCSKWFLQTARWENKNCDFWRCFEKLFWL